MRVTVCRTAGARNALSRRSSRRRRTALTAVTLAFAYAGRGLRRSHGALIIGGYLAFVAAVLIAS